MAVIAYKTGAEFPELPTHTPIPVVIKESNFFNEPDPFGENGATRDVVQIIMEATEFKYLGARIWVKFTASIHERSRLRPFIQAASSRDLSLDELKAFDTDKLVGKQLLVVGEYDAKDVDKKWLRPTSFLRVSAAEAVTSARPSTAASPTTAPKPAAVTVPDDALDF